MCLKWKHKRWIEWMIPQTLTNASTTSDPSVIYSLWEHQVIVKACRRIDLYLVENTCILYAFYYESLARGQRF